MRLEVFFDIIGWLPESDTAWRIEDFATAKSCNSKYGFGLCKIVGAWKLLAYRYGPNPR
jgi:hypothetical protein